MGAHRIDSSAGSAAKGKLSSVTKKRLVRFVTLYPKALVSDDSKVVHDIRVASRRLQQLLQLICPRAKSSGRKKLLRRLRKVRRAFGPCRNLDVNLNLVRGRIETTRAASARQAWEAVRVWLEEKRSAALEAARVELRQHELVDLIERLESLLENAQDEPEALTRLWERTKQVSAQWISVLDSAKANPDTDRIHAFRIAGKKLRYRAELLSELGNSAVKPIINALKSLQDDLGTWHDHSVLRDHVGEFIRRPSFMQDEPRVCRALLREMERDKRRDRAMIDDIMNKAAKIAQDWLELESKVPADDKAQKDQ